VGVSRVLYRAERGFARVVGLWCEDIGSFYEESRGGNLCGERMFSKLVFGREGCGGKREEHGSVERYRVV
jgi:hypothetical protein